MWHILMHQVRITGKFTLRIRASAEDESRRLRTEMRETFHRDDRWDLARAKELLASSADAETRTVAKRRIAALYRRVLATP